MHYVPGCVIPPPYRDTDGHAPPTGRQTDTYVAQTGAILLHVALYLSSRSLEYYRHNLLVTLVIF